MRLLLLLLLVVLVVGLGACGGDDDSGAPAAVAPPVAELRLDRLVIEGARVATRPVAPARDRRGVLVLPETGRGDEGRRLGGGIRFVSRADEARFVGLRVDGDAVSADVDGRRVEVLRLLDRPAVVTEPRPMVLSRAGASLLDAAFSTDQFVEGRRLGTFRLLG